MPVHPSEEEAPSGIFEKIAKDPSSASESTASDHGRVAFQLGPCVSVIAIRPTRHSREHNLPFPFLPFLPNVSYSTSYEKLTQRFVEHHENEHTPGKASAQDHQSKGPAIPMNMSGMSVTYLCERMHFQLTVRVITDMPPKASKEELKARSEELNK